MIKIQANTEALNYCCGSYPAAMEGESFGAKTGLWNGETRKGSRIEVLNDQNQTLVFEGDLEVFQPLTDRYPAVILDRSKNWVWKVWVRQPRPVQLTNNAYYPIGIHPSNFHYYPNPDYDPAIDGVPQLQIS